LKWFSKKWDGVVQTALIWFGVGLLWTLSWTFGFA